VHPPQRTSPFEPLSVQTLFLIIRDYFYWFMLVALPVAQFAVCSPFGNNYRERKAARCPQARHLRNTCCVFSLPCLLFLKKKF